MLSEEEKLIAGLLVRNDGPDVFRWCESIRAAGVRNPSEALSGLIDKLMSAKWMLEHGSIAAESFEGGPTAEKAPQPSALPEEGRAETKSARANGPSSGKLARRKAEEMVGRAGRSLWADDSVNCLSLSTRPAHILQHLKIRSVEELVSKLSSLAEERGCGTKVLCEIQEALLRESRRLDEDTLEVQLAALKMLSGSDVFVFDSYGRLTWADDGQLKPRAGAPDGGELLPLWHLALAEPLVRRLRMNGVNSIEELAALSADDLSEFPYIGSTAIERVKAALAKARSEGLLRRQEFSSMDEFAGEFSPQARAAGRLAFSLCAEAQPGIDQDRFAVFALARIEALLKEGPVDSEQLARSAADEFLQGRPVRMLARGEQAQAPDEEAGPSIRRPPTTGQAAVALSEWLDMLEGRDKEIMTKYYEGKTLAACAGECGGITRERVRQIIKRRLGLRPPIREEEHLHFFEAYRMTAEQFARFTGSSPAVYYFLQTIAQTKKEGRKPLEDALNDEAVHDEVKRAILEQGDGEAIYLEGERVELSKRAISDYLIKKFARDAYLSIDGLLLLYQDFLDEQGIEMRGSLNYHDLRAFQVFIERSEAALVAPRPKSDGRGNIRFYDAKSHDFSPLTAFLNSGKLGRMECSTAMLFKDEEGRRLLEDLDLRDEYEAHIAIRRFCAESEAFKLGRAPMINFGKASRNEQILQLICEMGPISEKEAAAEYERRYGVAKESVRGSFYHDFAAYRHQGMLTYTSEALTEEQVEFLRSKATGDYCSLEKVREAFSESFPASPTSLLNRANMEALGYRVSGGLLLRDGVLEKELFRKLLATRKQFSLDDEDFGRAVFDNTAFKSELSKRIRNLDIVEYRQDSYIKTEAFKDMAQPVSVSELHDYIETALAMMEPGVPYTVKKLRSLGLSHSIDRLREEFGFGDYFYASLIATAYVGGRIKKTYYRGTAVFCKTIGTFSATNLMEFVVGREGGMGVAQLCDRLRAEYGVDFVRAIAREYVKRSSMSLDPDSDRVLPPAAPREGAPVE